MDDSKNLWGPCIAISAIGFLVAILRPTIFGEVYSLQISILISIILVYAIFQSFKQKARIFGPNKRIFFQILIYFCLITYILLRMNFSENGDVENYLKSYAISTLFIVAMIFISTKYRFLVIFFDAFCIAVGLTLVSIVISMILLLAGFDMFDLNWIFFEYTYDGAGIVIFPFSMTHNQINTTLGIIPRLSGFYREPGCVPAMACWAATYSYARGWHTSFIVVCLLGGLASLSTLAPLTIFTAMLLVANKIGVKPVRAFILVCIMVVTLWSTIYSIEYIGLKEKIESGSGSFDERNDQTLALLDIENVIFGDGPGWSKYSTENINILSQSRSYGMLFFILCLYFISFSYNRGSIIFFAGLLPAIFTVFSSQPIMIEHGFVVIFFSWVIFTKNGLIFLESDSKLKR